MLKKTQLKIKSIKDSQRLSEGYFESSISLFRNINLIRSKNVTIPVVELTNTFKSGIRLSSRIRTLLINQTFPLTLKLLYTTLRQADAKEF